MEWIVNDQYNEKRIIPSNAMLDIKEHLKNTKCKISLSECAYFWQIRRDANGMYGCYGATGAIGPRSAYESEQWNNRPGMDDKNVQVSITFPMSKANAELVQKSKLTLTENIYSEVMPSWSVEERREIVHYTCGVYKKKGFDEAFHIMQKLKPSLTKEEFAKDKYDEWDEDLVEIRLYNTNDCIDTYTKYDYINTNIMNVTLTLLMIDIPDNMQLIKNIVQ